MVMFNDMPHGAFLMFPSMMEKTFGPVRERRAATLGWWLATMHPGKIILDTSVKNFLHND